MSDERQRDGLGTRDGDKARDGLQSDETPDFEGHRDVSRDGTGTDRERDGIGTDRERDATGRDAGI